eukprot:m.123433 g.123433  ORF g.123433 m.123433 type:complete len:1096 (+) comp9409_c0_seq3:194-3481(+)
MSSIPCIRTNEKATAVVQEMLDSLHDAGIPTSDFNDIQSLDGTFQKIINGCQSFEAISSPNETFGSAFKSYVSHEIEATKETSFGQVASSLTHMLAELNEKRDGYNNIVRNIVQRDIGVLVSGETTNNLRSKLEGSMRQYDRERSKKKSNSDRKRVSVSTQYRILQKTVCEYAGSYNTLRERRYLDFVQGIVKLFCQQMSFMKECIEVMEMHLPDITELTTLVTNEKKIFTQNHKIIKRFVDITTQEVFSCERREHNIAQLERESKKKHKRSASLGNELVDIDSLVQAHSPDVAEYLCVIFSIPANCVCADCDRPYPLYALGDIGMLVCDSCVRVHYVHKPDTCAQHPWSVLGRWSHQNNIVNLRDKSITTHDLFMIRAIGNESGNDVFEGGLASSRISKPSSLDDKEDYITMKYAELLFVSKEPIEGLTKSLRDGKYADIGVCSVLLKQSALGADILGADGTAALHLVIAEGNTLASDFLLRNGVNPNEKLNHNTALHVASQMDRVECAKLLVRYGADLNATNSKNSTPISVAQAFSSIGCSYLLATVAEGDIKMILQQPVLVESWDATGNKNTEYRSTFSPSLESTLRSAKDILSPPLPSEPPLPPSSVASITSSTTMNSSPHMFTPMEGRVFDTDQTSSLLSMMSPPIIRSRPSRSPNTIQKVVISTRRSYEKDSDEEGDVTTRGDLNDGDGSVEAARSSVVMHHFSIGSDWEIEDEEEDDGENEGNEPIYEQIADVVDDFLLPPPPPLSPQPQPPTPSSHPEIVETPRRQAPDPPTPRKHRAFSLNKLFGKGTQSPHKQVQSQSNLQQPQQPQALHQLLSHQPRLRSATTTSTSSFSPRLSANPSNKSSFDSVSSLPLSSNYPPPLPARNERQLFHQQSSTPPLPQSTMDLLKPRPARRAPPPPPKQPSHHQSEDLPQFRSRSGTLPPSFPAPPPTLPAPPPDVDDHDRASITHSSELDASPYAVVSLDFSTSLLATSHLGMEYAFDDDVGDDDHFKPLPPSPPPPPPPPPPQQETMVDGEAENSYPPSSSLSSSFSSSHQGSERNKRTKLAPPRVKSQRDVSTITRDEGRLAQSIQLYSEDVVEDMEEDL